MSYSHSAGWVAIRKVPDERTLAEMIGTARPRVNFFMNKFKSLGLFVRKISSVPTLCEQNQLVIGNGLNLFADRLRK